MKISYCFFYCMKLNELKTTIFSLYLELNYRANIFLFKQNNPIFSKAISNINSLLKVLLHLWDRGKLHFTFIYIKTLFI